MDCEICNKMLQAYLDGELEGEKFAEAELHISRCPSCKAELDRLVKLRDLLRELREVDVPPGEREAFIETLRRRIEAERALSPAPRKEINWRPALIGAIAVVALLILVLGISPERHVERIAPAPGISPLQDARIDIIIMGGLSTHFLATQGDIFSDPTTTGGEAIAGWRVIKDTHGNLLMPAE
jgi:anti-sigma factor RsiW